MKLLRVMDHPKGILTKTDNHHYIRAHTFNRQLEAQMTFD